MKHIFNEEIELQCSLSREKKNNDAIYVSASFIKINQSKMEMHFDLADILDISIKHKILLFHALIGGIFTPLILVAAFQSNEYFWILFFLGFGMLMLSYYGISGQDCISIKTGQKEFDFFLKEVPPHVKSFVQFLRVTRLSGVSDFKNFFYAVISIEVEEKLKRNGEYSFIEEGLIVYSKSNFERKNIKEPAVVIIDPFADGMKISYEETEENNSQFLLKGTLHRNNIVFC
ncbi:MAG: hypothetical protein OEY34_03435 [Cyclobacteriaceae bacterium]|nr:hypothetical protein [Cyclobacteriaceae bacterium]